MPGRRWAAGIAAIACIAFSGSSQALAATQRYASPAGSGTACSSGSPCSIQTAFTLENLGDEIILAPGDYGPISQSLYVQAGSYAHGVHGQPPPRIHMAAGNYLIASGASSRLSYVQVDGTNQPVDISENTLGDQIYVHATNGDACLVYGTLIDAVCWTSSSGGIAVNGAASATFTPVLRNVTAEATGPSGTGIEYHTSGGGHITVTVVNSIIHGTSTDIYTQASLPDTTIVNNDHSNFVTGTPSGSGAAINTTASQGQPPLFVNASAGDFHEAAGSPTINAGVTNPANGPFDFEGGPRVIGAATDIGGDEYDPFAGMTIGSRKSKVKKRKASVSIGCPADAPPPCAGTLALTYAQGNKTAGSTPFSIGAGASATLKVKISKKAFKKLDAKGKLATQAVVTATDGAGTSKTTSGSLKLKG